MLLTRLPQVVSARCVEVAARFSVRYSNCLQKLLINKVQRLA
jgi:hypothetical protein